MAKNTLPTNFKDDILNSSMGGKRRYNMIQNSDGTVSLEDASTYDQVGSEYGASQVNAANTAVNASADAGKIVDDIDDIGAITEEGYMAGALALKSVNNSLTASDSLKFQFATDGEGNYGYLGADDRFIPFKSGIELPFDLLSNYFDIQQDGFRLLGNTRYSSHVTFDITNANTISIKGIAYAVTTRVYISLTDEPLNSYNEIINNSVATMDFPLKSLVTLNLDISNVKGNKYIGLASNSSTVNYIGVSNIIIS